MVELFFFPIQQSMKYRLYYWFKGASPDRMGGPWWYRDFEVPGKRTRFLSDTQDFLHAWAAEDGADLPNFDLLYQIKPPLGVEINYAE